MAQQRLTVRAGGKIIGYVIDSGNALHFRPSAGTSLVQPINAQKTLKQLGEDIKLAIGVTGIQFQEIPRPSKAASKKRPTGHKKRRKVELSHKEWRAIERQETRLLPRAVSMESRDGGTSQGRPVSGGLPGLGKRR